jgi:hypothetical protein
MIAPLPSLAKDFLSPAGAASVASSPSNGPLAALTLDAPQLVSRMHGYSPFKGETEQEKIYNFPFLSD